MQKLSQEDTRKNTLAYIRKQLEAGVIEEKDLDPKLLDEIKDTKVWLPLVAGGIFGLIVASQAMDRIDGGITAKVLEPTPNLIAKIFNRVGAFLVGAVGAVKTSRDASDMGKFLLATCVVTSVVAVDRSVRLIFGAPMIAARIAGNLERIPQTPFGTRR